MALRGRGFSVALLVAMICGGCEMLAGIHSSAKLHLDAAAAMDAPGSDTAANPDVVGTDSAADTAQRAADADATTTADADEVGDTGSNDQSPVQRDGGMSPSDAGGERAADGPLCGADPSVAVPLTGTAFRFGSGPHGGSPGGKGLCGYLNGQLPAVPYYGAVDTSLYGTADRCGTCLRVEAGGVRVEVQIIDVVSPLPAAHGATISIDPPAQLLLSPAGGNPDVRFSFIPCSVTGNIQILFQASLDPTVLVMNHRNQLKTVQLVTAASTVDMTRQRYNLWTPPPGFTFGGGNVSLVLVDTFGNTARVSNVPVSTAWLDTGQQFPLCPS